MEQNKLKQLLLSIRKSKTNMPAKANKLAQAIENKGVLDTDAHILSSMIKDALTKRRKKEFYAEQLSNLLQVDTTNADATPTLLQG